LVYKATVKAVTEVAAGVATVYNWIDKNVTFGLLGWIGKNTFGRLYQFGNWIYDKCVPPKIVKDLRAAKGKN
jgi:divalent metal cation (Fe/Co/Zn/Cd) transporter